MNRKSAAGFASVASVVAMLCGAPAASATHDGTNHDEEYDLPAGLGCEFRLLIEGVDSNRHIKEFKDSKGGTVTTINAGKGFTLTYTNVETGKSITFESNGSVSKTTYDPATQTSTTVSTGHNGITLFPTDIPAGPSTTLYVGRVVYTVDAGGVWTLQSTSGTALDICAALG
ncbi:MAG TPA: hypothetical protein VJ617_12945 [Arthrobacter sp.]|nr:hypothetical protein [Arthrobacter sp.]